MPRTLTRLSPTKKGALTGSHKNATKKRLPFLTNAYVSIPLIISARKALPVENLFLIL
jgi:hypothetical protein